MELQITNETNDAAKSYVVNKMIEYNLRHFPEDLKGRYQAVNLYLQDANGKVYGGLIGERYVGIG
jgi:hypothetical protein